jgi:hypothetical protein
MQKTINTYLEQSKSRKSEIDKLTIKAPRKIINYLASIKLL